MVDNFYFSSFGQFGSNDILVTRFRSRDAVRGGAPAMHVILKHVTHERRSMSMHARLLLVVYQQCTINNEVIKNPVLNSALPNHGIIQCFQTPRQSLHQRIYKPNSNGEKYRVTQKAMLKPENVLGYMR